MAKVSWIKRKRKDFAKTSSRSLGLLPCPVCHRLPHLRFWGDSDYYFECHIARKPLEPQNHFPTVQEAANDWNEDVLCIKRMLRDADAVPVVRCRECIHYNESKRLCCVSGWVHDEDGFCNLGERRTDMGDWNFYEERYRMCKSFDKCADGCPAFDGFCTVKNEFLKDKGIEIVKEWSATHPRKTRQSALLELFQNVKLDDNGIVDIDTCKIEKYRAKFCPRSKNCAECRRAFWSEEIVL